MISTSPDPILTMNTSAARRRMRDLVAQTEMVQRDPNGPARPFFGREPTGYALNITTEERKLMSTTSVLREESMTTIMAFRLASVVTAINVLVASGFSITAIIRPQVLVPAEPVRTRASLLLAMYAAAPRNSSGFVRIVGNLQAGYACVADPGCGRRASCNYWIRESVCFSVIFGNGLGRSFSPYNCSIQPRPGDAGAKNGVAATGRR